MNKKREAKLEKNFKKMFWINSLISARFANIIFTLFYLARGLSLDQIFYLAIVWSIVSLLFEVPSSYLADKFGRKRTIILGCFLSLAGNFFFIFGHSFFAFSVGVILCSLQFACFSGTDEAIIYDTNKELGENDGLGKLGKYYSSQKFFKIIAPVLVSFLAKDLTDQQFFIVFILDICVNATAVLIAFTLVEPDHRFDVKKMEAGIIFDAFKLIRTKWELTRTILSKTLIFISSFIIWRFYQKFFLDLGLTIFIIGLATSLNNVIAFSYIQRIDKIFSKIKITTKINFFNLLYTVIAIIFMISAWVLANPYLLLILMMLLFSVEVCRNPLYSEYYNQNSNSYNRATTLSLSNFLKSVLDIPMLFFSAYLVQIDQRYVFVFSVILAILCVVFFKLPKEKNFI